jgi:dTDP-4-amino-4,6-dideoxygalactose transaminase
MSTGGEGGMVTTNDEALWNAMWSYKDHGKNYQAAYKRLQLPVFRWLHESFGTNWRMTEMQAAIGRIQLRRMADWTAQRQANAQILTEALQPFDEKTGPILLPAFVCSSGCNTTVSHHSCTSGCVHAMYKFYAYIRPECLVPGWNRVRIIEAINAEGVPCSQGVCPEVYLEKAFDNSGLQPAARLPIAQELGENSLMFLVHPTLTKAEMNRAATVLAQVLQQVSN